DKRGSLFARNKRPGPVPRIASQALRAAFVGSGRVTNILPFGPYPTQPRCQSLGRGAPSPARLLRPARQTGCGTPGRWLATPCRAFRWPKWPQVAAFWAFFTWPFSANYDVQAIYDGHVRVRRPLSSAGVKKPGKCGGKRSVVGGTRENPEKSGE